MKSLVAALVVACFAIATTTVGAAEIPHADAPPVGEIKSPVDAGTVQTRQRVVIQMHQRGTPMVAVRSLAEGSYWWVQDEGIRRGANLYEMHVSFGNDQTPPGTCFQITVLKADDANSAKAIHPGASWEHLPKGISHAHVITVFTAEPGANPNIIAAGGAAGAVGGVVPKELAVVQQTRLAARLVSPAPKSEAKRMQSVVFQLDEPIVGKARPRILVRSSEENSPWWVQDGLRKSGDGKRWSGVARYGNAQTPPGTEFLTLLVYPKTENASEQMSTGNVLTDLSEFECSETYTLFAR
ncbi:MAG: hypothetical protein WBD20_24605 [Pirellulaceae bacterium]